MSKTTKYNNAFSKNACKLISIERDVAPATAPVNMPESTVFSAGCPNAQQARPSSSLPQSLRWFPCQRTEPFQIFSDPVTGTLPQRFKDTPREDGRIPLGVRRCSGNAIPCLSGSSTPHSSDADFSTPFSFRSRDPLWEDLENYTPHSSRPSTPTPTAPLPPLHRTSRRTPRASPYPLPNPDRPRRSKATYRPATYPRSLRLYRELGLTEGSVSIEEIQAAYKKMAVKYHPDKVGTATRPAAHEKMARINAARDVLLDAVARTKYDKDGKLPWTT